MASAGIFGRFALPFFWLQYMTKSKWPERLHSKCLSDFDEFSSDQAFEMTSSVNPNLEEEPVFLSTVFPLS